jgi:hypothetical protein
LAFEALKKYLVSTPILVRLNFTKLFILDVDCPPKEWGLFCVRRMGEREWLWLMQVKAYPRAQRTITQWKGECYALIWVVMHFRQYLQHVDFILCMDHKPLEWLVIVSEAHGRRGCLVNMLQDFSLSTHPHGKRQTHILILQVGILLVCLRRMRTFKLKYQI